MDWNQDGQLDILSGCYWTSDYEAAHIQLLAGQGDQSFSEAIDLVDADGEPLVNQVADEPEQLPEEGAAPQPDMPNFNNICTHQHAVDYDGDGDLDLVVGNISDQFFVHVNDAGPDAEPSFSGAALQLDLSVPGGHSSPHLVDWDGDGDLDLLSGSSEGGVFLAENVGSREAPEWSAFKQLLATLSSWEQTSDEGQSIAPGRATRVWATDWNNDGLLDLLVGDMVTIINRQPGLSDKEYDAAKAKYEERSKEVQEMMAANSEAMQALDGEEPSEELQKKFQDASEAYRETEKLRAKFQDVQRTGQVWLFVRSSDAPARTASSESELTR